MFIYKWRCSSYCHLRIKIISEMLRKEIIERLNEALEECISHVCVCINIRKRHMYTVIRWALPPEMMLNVPKAVCKTSNYIFGQPCSSYANCVEIFYINLKTIRLKNWFHFNVRTNHAGRNSWIRVILLH